MGDIIVVPCLGTAVSTWTTPCEALRRFDSPPNTIPRSGMRAVIGGSSGINGLRGRACVCVCARVGWAVACILKQALILGDQVPVRNPRPKCRLTGPGTLLPT